MVAMGANLSLAAVVAAAVASETGWKAFSSFCEKVMSLKDEEEEREKAEKKAGEGAPWKQRAKRKRTGAGTSLLRYKGGDSPTFPELT